MVVVGDFNQRILRKGSPLNVHQRLTDTFRGWNIVTTGLVPGIDAQVIDHVALSDGLCADEVIGFSQQSEDGVRLSDHDGIVMQVAKADSRL
ncbi:MAG: hypothetical protein RIC12_01280 [Pirellulales bacterium]